jgi:hypothetical protein
MEECKVLEATADRGVALLEGLQLGLNVSVSVSNAIAIAIISNHPPPSPH